MESDRNRLQNSLRDSERESLQLQQQLRQTQEELEKSQNNNTQAQNTEKELQARLANETEERERVQLQLHQTKKQLQELEGSLEVTRQELGKLRAHLDEEDERARGREQELMLRLEDARSRERKLEDQKHNLEVCLADASQQIQELKARLSGSEGRLRALDTQLAQTEVQKKEVENKLSSVLLILRRIAGIQLDGTVSTPFKLTSPTRRYSPVRGTLNMLINFFISLFKNLNCVNNFCPAQEHAEGNRELILDVDPEAVRRGVKTLMQQVAQIERERVNIDEKKCIFKIFNRSVFNLNVIIFKDDYKIELNSTRKILIEAQENQDKVDNKLCSLQVCVRNLQDEKNTLETKLIQRQTLLQGQVGNFL